MKKIYFRIGLLVLLLFFNTIILFSQNKITTFPYEESFETGMGDWIQSSSDIFDWSWNSGGTPSSGTGPNAAYDGSYYIYTEASSNFNNSTYLDASFDFSGISNPFLFFYYHMFGINMGSLHIDVWNGTWNNDVFELTGQQQTDYSSNWKQAAIDLTSFAGNDSVVIRLRGITGPSWESDICIDKISVLEPANMSYISSTVAQPITTNVSQNSTKNVIAVIEVTNNGYSNPLKVNSFTLNSVGSDDFIHDVNNIKIFYTQSDSAFSTSTLFGSSTNLSSPITGNATLSTSEKNYFWITYDITEDATPENIIDVECTTITFEGTTGDQNPIITNPAGNRTIDYVMNFLSSACYTASTDNVMQSKKDNAIIGFIIQTENSSNPLNVSEIKFKPTGSDDYLNDIYKVHVYYTANSDVFDNENLFGTIYSKDSIITGSQKLVSGDNYFWIAYDIYPTATVGNKVDAECHYLIIDDVTYFPTDSAPAGDRTIIEYSKYSNFMPANIVVGQPDFYTQNTTYDEFTGTGYCGSDISSKGLFAVISQQARILLYNEVPDSNGAPANIILGQPNFSTATYGCSDKDINWLFACAFSPDGNKLIVSDAGNNRVLIWNAPFTTYKPADVVIGQTDFYSNDPGCSPTQMNIPSGVFVSPDGKLFITDMYNNRVLVYNSIPTSNGAKANIVLGQQDMYSNSPGNEANQMYAPTFIAVSLDGKLIISDPGNSGENSRVLIFNSVPTENGASADVVIGQSDFGISSSGCSQTNMFYQFGVTVSPSGELAIGEFGNNRVLIYNKIPDTNGAPADFVLGQPDFLSNTGFNGGVNEKSMLRPYGINFDLNGRLYVNGRDMHRVMIYGELPTDTADLQILITANKSNPHVGESITYTFTFTNNGPNGSSDIVLKSALPGLFKLINYTVDKGEFLPYGGTWNIPYIASGESIDLILDGTIEDGGGDITTYSNIIASSAIDNHMDNNATSLTINVVNDSPIISEFTNDTIVQGTETNWIPFTIEDSDSDMSKLEVIATSSDETIVPNFLIELSGDTENRFLRATPYTDQSGAVNITVTVSDGFTEDQSSFELYILSNNANLSDLDTSGTTITGFRADSLTYTCELTAGATTVPTVTAIAENSEALVNIYETDTIPGITTVEVIAEDGTVQNYLVTFVLPVLADNDASLTDLKVDGTTITNFSPIRYHYTQNLPYGTAIVPSVNAVAKNALATIELIQTIALPGRDSIVVTAVDGVTEQVYTIDYLLISASDNNNLQKIFIDGEEIVTFDPEVLDYTFEYPYGTTAIPMVIAVPEDAKAFVDQTDATSMPGTTTLDVYAEDGTMKTYTLEFTLAAASMDATLADLNVDGITLFGFNPTVYSYDVELENSVITVPEVTAEANHDSAEVVITDATTIPGITSVVVTAQDGTTDLTYLVNFSYKPLSTISLLSDLKVDGVTIDNFSPDIFNYMYKLPAGTTIPASVTATVYDTRATKIIVNATSMPGTTTITVTAEDGSTSEYTVYFTFDNLSSDATLSDLKVNTSTIAGFNSATLTYNVVLPYGTTVVPNVTATATDVNAQVDITDATSLPGKTTIIITAEDEFTENTYEVNFTVAPNSDATLSNLKVNATTIAGFNSATLTYNVELTYGTTVVPDVTATATDANADVSITDATSLPGTTSVLVTAEDETTTKTYSVIFTFATSVNDLSLSKNINIYPNPSNGIFNISIEINKISNGSIDIYNSIGSKVYMKDLQNNTDLMHTVDLSTMPKGMYFVKIIVNEKSFTKELIIQ